MLSGVGASTQPCLARLRLSGIFAACMMPLLLIDHLFLNLLIVTAGSVKCCVAVLKVFQLFIMVLIIFSVTLRSIMSC